MFPCSLESLYDPPSCVVKWYNSFKMGLLAFLRLGTSQKSTNLPGEQFNALIQDWATKTIPWMNRGFIFWSVNEKVGNFGDLSKSASHCKQNFTIQDMICYRKELLRSCMPQAQLPEKNKNTNFICYFCFLIILSRYKPPKELLFTQQLPLYLALHCGYEGTGHH